MIESLQSTDPTSTELKKGAYFSDDKLHRFELWRLWDPSKGFVMFLMHNPSIADSDDDDNTITRCINFAKSWGKGGIYVGNIFSRVSTNPKNLRGKTPEELCPLQNLEHIKDMVRKCDLHVLAYGNPILKGTKPERWDDFWHYLRLTKQGNPGHPLFLPGTLKPIAINTPIK